MKTLLTIFLTLAAALGVGYYLSINGYIQISGGQIAIQIGGHHNKIEQTVEPSQTVIPAPPPSSSEKRTAKASPPATPKVVEEAEPTPEEDETESTVVAKPIPNTRAVQAEPIAVSLNPPQSRQAHSRRRVSRRAISPAHTCGALPIAEYRAYYGEN